MKPLWPHWETLARRLRRTPHWLLASDLDGTLVPFRRRPDQVRLPAATRRILRRLAARGRTTVAIVSGRSLGDLRRRIDIPGLMLIGNHGYEIERDGEVFIHPAADAKAGLMKQIAQAIGIELKRFRGAWVEHKGCTLSVHVREAAPRTAARALIAAKAVVRRMTLPGSLDLRPGHKVLEIRPERRWHKGAALRRLRRTRPPGTCVIFLGDDLSDEDAFAALQRGDIGIRVGAFASTRARYGVSGPDQAVLFLRRLSALDTGGTSRD